mmetsp:Transcript_25960/g.34779  ORF Transcript_25960/g.34779 Transcript_25960/m.34779 type:complete len:96 (-) Transcript_25960:143-430(-)
MIGCDTAEPHPAVLMGQFNGKRVCGKAADFDFMTIVRVQKDGNCPSGYQACNPGSKHDNIVCVPDEGRDPRETLCPINSLEIHRKPDLPTQEEAV